MSEWPQAEFDAYLAAFLDGEGCIEFVRRSRSVKITLANCHLGVLKQIQDRLGYGTIYSQQQRAHWTRRYVLRFSNAMDCSDFLHRTMPRLIIKAPRAQEAMARVDSLRQDVLDLDQRNAQIIAAVRTGMRGKAVAKQFQVSPQLVSRLLNGHRWPSCQEKAMKLKKTVFRMTAEHRVASFLARQ